MILINFAQLHVYPWTKNSGLLNWVLCLAGPRSCVLPLLLPEVRKGEHFQWDYVTGQMGRVIW